MPAQVGLQPIGLGRVLQGVRFLKVAQVLRIAGDLEVESRAVPAGPGRLSAKEVTSGKPVVLLSRQSSCLRVHTVREAGENGLYSPVLKHGPRSRAHAQVLW